MTTIPARDLRNDVSGVLRRVEQGERMTVTVSGRPVAHLLPVPRPTWVPARALLHRLDGVAADVALLDELRGIVPDTTDDLPL